MDRAVRRELDRLAGELLRRQGEVDASLRLYARREHLRGVAHCKCSYRRAAKFAKWVVS